MDRTVGIWVFGMLAAVFLMAAIFVVSLPYSGDAALLLGVLGAVCVGACFLIGRAPKSKIDSGEIPMTAEVKNNSDHPWFWVGVAAVIGIVVLATMYFTP